MNIIITGTSSGIGFGLAKYYCSQNNNVIGLSRRENNELNSLSNFKFHQCDLTDHDQINKAFNTISEQYPSLDLVILNAGILGEIKSMDEQNLSNILSIMDINVWANKVILDNLFGNKVHINQVVGISSGAAKNGSAGWGPYSISKAAFNMLLKTYAAENPNTHFSSVAPGLVDTAMQDYISSLESSSQYPTIDILKSAKGTKNMPPPEALAQKLDSVFKKVLEMENGVFIDIREMK